MAVFDNWVEALFENCYRNIVTVPKAGKKRIVTDLQFFYNCEIALTKAPAGCYNQCVGMSCRLRRADGTDKEDALRERIKGRI